VESQELFELDRAGFIPGPGETEEAFLERVAQSKQIFEQGDWIPESHWDFSRHLLVDFFHVKPLYICAVYSNKNLAPWQGAATWTIGKRLHHIQLKEGLKKGSYLKIYSRAEILAHEAVHAARSGFHEDKYEEFFAYMTSEKKWRRILGPIIQRPWEVWPFFLFMTTGILWQASYLGATIWLILGFSRLIFRHATLKRAAKQILEKIGDERRVRAILFRLTDKEIKLFAKGENIIQYAKNQKCLRWRVLQNYLA